MISSRTGPATNVFSTDAGSLRHCRSRRNPSGDQQPEAVAEADEWEG